jgi:metallo-beta-lactamase class B
MVKRSGVLALASAIAAFLLQPSLGANAPAAAQAAKKVGYSESFRGSQRDNVEFQKIAPFKVFDNLYYVGPGFVSVWLVPTRDGAILIDTAQEPYVEHVMASITKSGFDLKAIKYIILTHGHLEDWRMIESAGTTPSRGNAPPPRVPKRDMLLKEGDTLSLGGQTLKFYKHPGHTPGSLSIEFTVYDNGQPHKAFVFGGPGPRGGVSGGFLRA